ncbi:MaoC family dehydratase [Micromonospora sp. NPDC047707]|uniref:MaoC family dehydratase n=1 Tax=Micromonospora sp. NPDC047707 TaxID=3154498 RepID=UPI003455678F
MPAAVITGADGVRALVGTALGQSGWELITQDRVNRFADATGDNQWIHVDVARATRDSAFGGPIAHGYLTLSLIPLLLPQIVEIRGFTMGVNYGCEKVRFPAPVLVGSRVRATAVIDEVTDVTGGIQMRITATIEIEGNPKPACVATVLLRRYV